MTEHYIMDADPQNILKPPTAVDICARILGSSDPISTYYIFMTRSARGITSIKQKWLDTLREI